MPIADGEPPAASAVIATRRRCAHALHAASSGPTRQHEYCRSRRS